MRMLSIKNLTDGLAAVSMRFPFEMFFALTGTIAGIAFIEFESIRINAESWSMRTIMVANLGFLLSLAVSLYCESKQILPSKAVLLKLVAALVTFLLIFVLDPLYEQADRIRFFLLSLSFHLLVAFAAFTVKGHVQGFWQFNKALFLRFLTGVLYSAVLFAGISAALGAMNFLFNFKFEWDTFAILWTCIVGLFSTTFFLGGIPADVRVLDADESYPKGLKIFTQYVLIPLATIYVAILLTYEVKILLQWNLPKGMVSNLVLCYAVFGILSVLLVYPIRNLAENKWIKTYARSFYFLLLPLIVLLLLAVGTRVSRYGITEWRYFLIVLAGWLLLITVYFLVSKKQNIKLIPISLSLLTLLTVYGPQSSFSVAKYSQQRVLVDIFKKNNAYKDGKLIPVDSTKISKKDGNRAVATLDYLVNHHDLTSLAAYIPVDLNRISDSLMKTRNKWSHNMVDRFELRRLKLYWVKHYLHLSAFYGYDYSNDISIDTIAKNENIFFEADQSIVVTVKGFDYYLDKQAAVQNDSTYMANHIHFKCKSNNNDYRLIVEKDTLNFEVRAAINQLLQDRKKLERYRINTPNTSFYKYHIPAAMLDIAAETPKYKAVFRIVSMSCTRNKSGRADNIDVTDGAFLIKAK